MARRRAATSGRCTMNAGMGAPFGCLRACHLDAGPMSRSVRRCGGAFRTDRLRPLRHRSSSVRCRCRDSDTDNPGGVQATSKHDPKSVSEAPACDLPESKAESELKKSPVSGWRVQD
jgi:hypothetical protein